MYFAENDLMTPQCTVCKALPPLNAPYIKSEFWKLFTNCKHLIIYTTLEVLVIMLNGLLI